MFLFTAAAEGDAAAAIRDETALDAGLGVDGLPVDALGEAAAEQAATASASVGTRSATDRFITLTSLRWCLMSHLADSTPHYLALKLACVKHHRPHEPSRTLGSLGALA